MSKTAQADDWRIGVRRLVVITDFVLLLFPPLQWLFASGPASLGYFLIANLIVAASLFLLRALTDSELEAGQ